MGCGNSKKQPFALDPLPEVYSEAAREQRENVLRVTRLQDLHVKPALFAQKVTWPVKDRYLFLEAIGKGAEGEVYRAEHKLTKELRAVKIAETPHTDEVPRLQWEAEVLSALDHPNIIKVYEFGGDGDSDFLVEEMCSGGELLRYIQHSGRLHETEAAAVIKQVLCAVSYCHDRNIVHRDVKPENLLLASAPTGPKVPTIKLIDFGFSCYLSSTESLTERTGSLLYMSPEMVRGEPYSSKTDVWSCGVILYILLTGFPPFAGARDVDIERKIARANVIFPLTDIGGVSKEAKKLVLRMLDKNPETRWSAAECLGSSWFSAIDLESSYLTQEVQASLTKLGMFPESEKLKTAFFGFIAVNFSTREDLQGLEETFRSLDKDGDGRLTRDELLQALQKAVPYYTALSFTGEIMRKVDTSNTGSISYSQFLMAAADKSTLLSEAILKAAFDTIDLDRSGKISVGELRDMMKTQAELSQEVLTELIQQADDNGDGEIEFSEFLRLMQSRPSM